MELQTDSYDYDVLFDAATSIKNVPGTICEIGTRRGGSLKFIIDGLLSVDDNNRNVICIDPYGNIDYHMSDSRFAKSDYTNDMRNEAMSNIYTYVNKKPINVVFVCLEDTEFFSRFSDGFPFYLNDKIVSNQYALVFFDGPHDKDSLIKEVEFFLPRTVVGSQFVFDDVSDYDHQVIHNILLENNFKEVSRTDRKISYVKVISIKERFKALELQAYVESESEWIDPSSNMPVMVKGREFSREKFAELIVNRCAAIVSLYRRDNLQDKAVADTLESAYREIKLSFGLKP